MELALPAFRVGEAYEASVRKWKRRRELHDALRKEIGQMGRSKPYEASSKELRELTSLLLRSVEEQQSRLEGALDEILSVARILPLERTTFSKAVEFQKTRSLEPQDAIVYASVMADLERDVGGQSCFVTRNPKDFANPDIEDGDLAKHRRKLLTTFAAGLNHVRAPS